MLGFVFILLQAVVPAPAAPPAATALNSEYQIGVTTLSDITAKLGKPNSMTTISDGSTIAVFTTTRTRVKGASYMPIVGLFASGAKTRVSMRMFTFGPDGRLKTFTSTDTNADCSVGIAGGGCH